jgi:hypothetical protein
MIDHYREPFVPLLCRLRLHRWRIAFGAPKGTCRCERCGELRGPGAK